MSRYQGTFGLSAVLPLLLGRSSTVREGGAGDYLAYNFRASAGESVAGTCCVITGSPELACS